MKFESIKSRLPRDWRNFLRTSSYDSTDSSESSTIYVETEDAALKHHVGVPIVPRVRFCEEQNQFYDNDPSEEYIVPERWYTKSEVHLCRAETRGLALIAGDSNHEQESDNMPWPRCLEQMYLSFCSWRGDEGQEVMIQTTLPPPCQVFMVGLERRVLVRTVARDKHTRRRRLLHHFQMIYDTVVDPDTRAHLIAQSSIETTLPSRRYAAFLAEWWWYAKDEDDGEQEI